MLWVLADDIHPPPALDDLALFASDFHGCSHFHSRVLVSRLFAFPRSPVPAFPFLSVSVRNPPARRIIGREFHFHPVTGQNPDEVDPHLPGDMRQYPVAAGQLDPEHRIGQHLHNRPLNLNRVLLRHPSPRPRPETSSGTTAPRGLAGEVCGVTSKIIRRRRFPVHRRPAPPCPRRRGGRRPRRGWASGPSAPLR